MSSSSGVATAVEDGGGLNGRGVPARERERERERGRRIDVWRRWWNGNLEKTRRERERAGGWPWPAKARVKLVSNF
jgi:hypothetical protein